jgi:amidase
MKGASPKGRRSALLTPFADFDRYDGLGLAQLVRRGEVRSSELVEEAISRIETRNPQINAVVFKTFESARAAAAAPSAGPFAGVPFLLKDMSASWARQTCPSSASRRSLNPRFWARQGTRGN